MHQLAVPASLITLLALPACSSASFGQSSYPNDIPAPHRSAVFPDTSFRVDYSFGTTGKDASGPYPAPVAVNGVLYGTTSGGGKYALGSVYSISSSGVETVLHSFNGADGQTPWSGLLYYNGAFYGTTFYGGKANDGTVYRIGPKGSYKLLYTFRGGSKDGSNPVGVLVALNGLLYGTTGGGGPYNQKNGGYGTAFSITTGGSTRILHFFRGAPDGEGPWGSLIVANGMLFGTSFYGGKYGAGCVYRITTAGSVKIVHSFSGPDGELPESNVIYQNKWLYGTASRGGAYGFGSVFKVGLGGMFQSLYSFTGTTDGCHPLSGLTSVNGNLFGLTDGAFCTSSGTMFMLNPSGDFTSLHTFNGRSGGGEPIDFSGLTLLNGRLHGTTWEGGHYGSGTLFSIAP